MSAKGGITEGKSHKEGGIPMVVKSTGQHVELEGGEGVINKRNMASEKTFEFEGKEKTICEIASEINSADGNGVQIDCDNVTGKKYKYKKGGNILSEEEEQDFDAWFEDGNVYEIEDGVYATQDYQWNNRIKGKEELKKFFAKEYLDRRYAEGGGVDDYQIYVYSDEESPTGKIYEIEDLRFPTLDGAKKYAKSKGYPIELVEMNYGKYKSGGSVDAIVLQYPYTNGNFREDIAKENISKIMNHVSFRKFGNEFRKHIQPNFTQENNSQSLTANYRWSELASYIIGDGSYYVTEEEYNNFIKSFNTKYEDRKFANGGGVQDYKSLIGKYVNIYSMGVSLPTEHQIKDVMVSGENFRYRYITLKFDIGIAPIPFDEGMAFMGNQIIYVNDNKEEFGIQLIPNQYAKGGRMPNTLKLEDYESASMSMGGYEEQMIVPQSTTGMYKEGGKVEYVDINGRNTYYFLRFPEAIGSFAWMYNDKYNEGILYNLDEFDKDYYSHLPLKSGEKLFRYSTERMIDGSKRLIKINLDRGLIYFMSEDNDDNDDKNVKFDTRGIKSQYIVLNKDMFAEGGKIVVFAENEEGYYRKISEHDTMRGAKTKMKNLLDTEEYYGVGVVPIDEWEKRYAPYPFKEGGDVPKASKMFHLPLELAVYVPSTQDVDEVISEAELKARVNEVSKYLASTFGGFTKSERVGGFMTSKSELVTEDVVPVVSFATKEDYEANKENLVEKLSEWARKWGQEAIGFEFEGDLYYVPQKFSKGGGVDSTTKYKVGDKIKSFEVKKIVDGYDYKYDSQGRRTRYIAPFLLLESDNGQQRILRADKTSLRDAETYQPSFGGRKFKTWQMFVSAEKFAEGGGVDNYEMYDEQLYLDYDLKDAILENDTLSFIQERHFIRDKNGKLFMWIDWMDYDQFDKLANFLGYKYAQGGGVDNVMKKKVKSYEELQNHPLVDFIEREYNAGAFDGTDYSYWLYLKDGYIFESLGTTHLHEGFKKDLIRAFNEENIISKPNQFKEGGDVRDFSWYQDFKKKELKRGTEHEMEHIDTIREFKKKGVSDREVAEAIAKDHLEEDGNYYIELEKMESSRKVSEALGEFKKNKTRKKNIRKFNVGGFMGGSEGEMIYVKMKEDVTTDLFTLSGDYFSDSTFKKDSVNLMNFISNNGYSTKLELYQSGVYADLPNKSFEVVGYDSNKYGKGGDVKPQFDSLLLSPNDKKIMEVLRTLNEENATHQQREMISQFRGYNVVNELTNQMISKIYGLLFQWHNLENPIHNILIQNAGAGNLVSLVPANLMHNVYISFDENNLFYSVESKICGIVNTTIKFSELNDYAMKSVDAIVKVYAESNPKYDTLVGDLYKSDKRAIIVGVAEFNTLKHLEDFKVTIGKNLGGLAQNQMLIPKSTHYVVINDGITDEANYTLIYGVTKI